VDRERERERFCIKTGILSRLNKCACVCKLYGNFFLKELFQASCMLCIVCSLFFFFSQIIAEKTYICFLFLCSCVSLAHELTVIFLC
jgi:hypothetical protein